MIINKINIYRIFIVIYIYVFSFYFLNIYTKGDQKAYLSFWNEIPKYDFISGFVYFNGALSSYEIGYYSIVYLFSSILEFDKNLFISFTNVMLGLLIFEFFNKYNINKLFSIIFLLSNFYILVLFFSAERLKFGIIFLLLVCIFNIKNRFFLLSPLFFHLSVGIIYLTILTKDLFYNLFHFKINKRNLFFIISLFIFGLFFNLHLIYKLSSYYLLYGGPFEWIKTFIFYLLLLCYIPKNKIFEVSFIFFTLSFIAIIMGDIRVNMFSYMFFLYYFITLKKTYTLPFLVTFFYFSLKGILFLLNILIYGNGFENV